MGKKIGLLTLVLMATSFVGQGAYGATTARTFGATSTSTHQRLAFDWWSDLLNYLFGNGNNGGDSNGGTTHVPEPATMAMLAVGIGGVVIARRKKS